MAHKAPKRPITEWKIIGKHVVDFNAQLKEHLNNGWEPRGPASGYASHYVGVLLHKPAVTTSEICVVRDTIRTDFIGQVNALLAEGWELHGGPIEHGFSFLQYLKREVPK
jgi:hypothetical protein